MSIEELLNTAVDVAINKGAKEAIAKVLNQVTYQIRFSNSQIDISKQWNKNILELFLAKRRRINVVNITDPTISKIEEIIPKAAENLGKISKSLLYWGMAKNKYNYNSIEGLYYPDITEFYEKVPELVNESVNQALDVGAKKVAGVLYFGHSKTGVLTSYGNGGIYDTSDYQYTIRSFIDAESSGQQNIVGRDLNGINNKFNLAGKESAKLAKNAVSGKQGKAGTYDIIMSPTVAANIFGHIINGANPVYIIGKMSCLKGKMNKKIAPNNLSVTDNPLIEEGLNSRPFDFEGVPSQVTPIIKDGVLRNLIHNTSSAKIWKLLGKWRTKSTANSWLGSVVMEDLGPKVLAPLPTNNVYSAGDYDLDEIIAESQKPTIYVTSNWYTRFTNNLEGIFSTIPRDAMFLIENGEIRHPIRKIRIADNLLRMLKNIQCLGNDLQQVQWWEVETPTFIPTIKVKDVSITAATK
ncbi:MAG: hypothetical protein GF364_12325 [Candidatus Lokiarchaeota archaeon]|nr:hypothetical protein [Candidatus Lokiarchaeota archaeon]